MLLLNIVKQLSIIFGVYRPARWLSRRLRPTQLQAHLENTQFYGNLIPNQSLCFDIGANIGEMSEAMLLSGARVISFEPNIMLLQELRARCEHYKGFTFIGAALGSNPAFAPFFIKSSHVLSSLANNWEGDVIATHHVPILTLDLAIQAFGLPDYCKIDVEGWELEVLNGLTKAVPLIPFEFNLNYDEDIQKTLLCLEKLEVYGKSYVNITPAERCRFHFNEWMPLKLFREWFPGNLRETLPGYLYGNIYVRNDTVLLIPEKER